MNQILKRCVYRMATVQQAKFLARLGNMDEDETEILLALNKGKDDQYIMDQLGVTKNAYDLIERSMRAKILLAVFNCINFRMEAYKD